MLDGIWNVYKRDGSYLGEFQTRIGNDVLILNAIISNAISIGEILHMDETHTKRAWEVRVTGNFRGRPTEFEITKLSDRAQRYPDRPKIVSTS